jgi:hypothetical protein
MNSIHCASRSQAVTRCASDNRRGFRSRIIQAAAIAGTLAGLAPAFGLVITPTFTANFNSSFGVNAAAAQAAWISAASIFTTNFSDNIHINLTVDGVPGTSVFGQSNTFLNSTSYANLRTLVVADASTANDNVAIGAGGSVAVTDPTAGAGTWWVSRAEAKAIGLIPDDLNNDGTTTFGAGNPFTFAGPIAANTYDFQGVCAHEIAEVMGRLGISGGTIGSFTNSYSLIDLFGYSGPGARKLTDGANDNFSIDNGTTLLKLYNNSNGTGGNGLDTKDWASGTNDSFNQFASPGVVNPVTPVDLQEMDVIGYNLAIPEPTSLGVLALGVSATLARRRRKLA